MHTVFQKFFLFLIICIIMTLIYYNIPNNHFGGNINDSNKLFNCFYYSIISGSTLGFGDIYPKTNITKLLVIGQIFLLFFIIAY
jgi:hypothetical protein